MEELTIGQLNESELSNYQGIKEKIKTELKRVTQSFVEIGYRLKQVREEKLYELDGYSNINEFAKAEYNLSQSTTSRFIAINDRYSVNGSSSQLLEQYEGYGYSILSEMLTLSEEEIDLVTVQTTRAEIRDIKQAKAEAEGEIYAPAHNVQTIENTQSEPNFDEEIKYIIPEADKLIIEMFRDKKSREDLKELAAVLIEGVITEIKVFEIINPSGYRVTRKGALILMFGEKEIKFDDFRGGKAEYTYKDFLHDLLLVFDMSQKDPWVAFYGEPEPEPVPKKPEPQKQEPKKPERKQEKKEVKQSPKDKKTEEKPKITQSKPEEDENENTSDEENGALDEKEEQNDAVPGQHEISDYPEFMPEPEDSEEKSEVLEADIVERVPTRQQDNSSEIIDRAARILEIHNYPEDEFMYSNDLIDISLNIKTGVLQVIIKNNQDGLVKSIKAVDSCTGCISGVINIE